MKIRSVEVRPVSWELENPFRTTLGEKSVSKNVLVTVELEDGARGVGEASSSLALPQATQESMFRVLCEASGRLLRQPIRDWENLAQSLYKDFPDHVTALAALECALLDAYCRFRKMPLYKHFGRKRVGLETHYTFSALDPARCAALARRLARKGYRKFKVKVTGRDPEADFQRVVRVAKSAARTSILVDANQGWSAESALRFIERLRTARLPVTLVEQPVPKEDLKGLRFVRERSPVPVAADESLRSLEDAERILHEDAADVFNLKLAKCGLLEALKIARLAKKARKKLMIGCMMESAAGLAASAHWACGSADFDFIDLDSFLLLRPTGIRAGFQNRGPRISVAAQTLGSGTELPA